MYPLDRTHPAGRDLDWLPVSLKAIRWGITGGVAAGIAGGSAAALALGGPGMVVFAKLGILLGAGGVYAGDRAARALLLSRVRKLARGDVDLGRLPREADGELFHLRGRVRARTTLPSALHGRPVVFRRVHFRIGGKPFIHEAAVDFDLQDGGGERIAIQVAGARMLAPTKEALDYPTAIFRRPDLPPSLAAVLAPRAAWLEGPGRTFPATEVTIADGVEIEVVGYKTRAVDPTVVERLERETPMRAALRSGRALPLLVSIPGARGED